MIYESTMESFLNWLPRSRKELISAFSDHIYEQVGIELYKMTEEQRRIVFNKRTPEEKLEAIREILTKSKLSKSTSGLVNAYPSESIEEGAKSRLPSIYSMSIVDEALKKLEEGEISDE